MLDPIQRITTTCAAPGWRLAYSICRHRADAEDVIQQAYLVALRKPAGVPDEPWPWFAGVIRNCARNQRRKDSRLIAVGDIQEQAAADPGLSPATAAAKIEIDHLLMQSVRQLPIHEREAVALCHLGGLSHAQAAEILGLKLNTVKSHVRRGLERIRSGFRPSRGSVEAYLATIACPMPLGGWPAAIQRWESQKVGLALAPMAAWLAAAGLAGAALWMLLFGAWQPEAEPATRVAKQPLREFVPDRGPAQRGESKGRTQDSIDEPSSYRPLPEAPILIAGGLGASGETRPGARIVEHSSRPGGAAIGRVPDDAALVVREAWHADGYKEARWHAYPLSDEVDIKHGHCQVYFADGSIREEGTYEHGCKAGKWSWFHECGTPYMESFYVSGVEHGLCVTWHPNSELASTGRVEHGQRTGEWRYYHANSLPAKVFWFVQGQLDGLALHFAENGSLIGTCQWLKGKRHGEEVTYRDGQPPVIRRFRHGELVE